MPTDRRSTVSFPWLTGLILVYLVLITASLQVALGGPKPSELAYGSLSHTPKLLHVVPKSFPKMAAAEKTLTAIDGILESAAFELRDGRLGGSQHLPRMFVAVLLAWLNTPEKADYLLRLLRKTDARGKVLVAANFVYTFGFRSMPATSNLYGPSIFDSFNHGSGLNVSLQDFSWSMKTQDPVILDQLKKDLGIISGSHPSGIQFNQGHPLDSIKLFPAEFSAARHLKARYPGDLLVGLGDESVRLFFPLAFMAQGTTPEAPERFRHRFAGSRVADLLYLRKKPEGWSFVVREVKYVKDGLVRNYADYIDTKRHNKGWTEQLRDTIIALRAGFPLIQIERAELVLIGKKVEFFDEDLTGIPTYDTNELVPAGAIGIPVKEGYDTNVTPQPLTRFLD